MTQNHPWHAVSCGEQAPEIVNAIIEIPKGSRAKYELDKATGLLRLDRVLFAAVHYPANYGFIPHTYCGDRDPLDILVLCSLELQPLCLLEAYVIGVMHMHDSQAEDDKIIAVARHDESVNSFRDIAELPPHTLLEIKHFFENYKKLEHKESTVDKLAGRTEAQYVISQSMQRYQQAFG
jgi:inorganic pyrophosphatase